MNHKSETPAPRSPRKGLLFAAFSALFSASALFAGSPPTPAMPNILLITADDLGLEVGCYGDKLARTPVIDKLARDGVRFQTAWVTQSSCSPSRASILMGTYPHQNGQLGLAHRGFTTRGDSGIRLPNVLKKAGYFTGLIGKLHVAPEEAFDFDVRVGDPEFTRDIKDGARAAENFIRDAGGRPFFLKFSFVDPHGPYIPSKNGSPREPRHKGDVPWQGWVRAIPDSDDVADYYSCVDRLDEGMGLLLDALKKSGKSENTLVIFLGDNGSPFPGGKVTCYEAGMRVPLIAFWAAGGVSSGRVLSEMASTVDLMPTILQSAGLPVPPELPGQSLLPIMQGKTPAHWPEYLFGEMNFHRPCDYTPMRTVRDQRFHLIYSLLRPECELFDLQADPFERHNVAGNPEFAADLARLRKALNDWQVATKDPLLDPKTVEDWRQFVVQFLKTNQIEPPACLVPPVGS
jgi:N-sulfoglucosamine sulfohydrolase